MATPLNKLSMAEQFAAALDAADYGRAAKLLDPNCIYDCRGERWIGPEEIIRSYAGNGKQAEDEFDGVIYRSRASALPDGVVEIEFEDELQRGGLYFLVGGRGREAVKGAYVSAHGRASVRR